MGRRTYTIGELSRLSGVSVRRIRFYSDRGLLPPVGRTSSNYRVYSDTDIARLDLIRSLSDAGVALDSVEKLLTRQLSLTDVLAMRLETLEAEIAAQRRIANVLRATLKVPNPTEADLRRLWTMTTLSTAQFRVMIERFFDRVAENAKIDDGWKRQMIDVSMPDLPEKPTPEQIDAWNELTAMVTDEDYIALTRANMASMWNDSFDPDAYLAASRTYSPRCARRSTKAVRPLRRPVGRSRRNGWSAPLLQ